MKRFQIILLLLFVISFCSAQLKEVDYRYAPEWHVTSICFPDDSLKTIVGPLGQLFYGFSDIGEKGQIFYPYIKGRGFYSVIHFFADEGMKIQSQKLHSPKVPIVETYSTYSGMDIIQEAISLARDYISSCISTQKGNREDMILTTVKNNTGQTKRIHPQLIINSRFPIEKQGNIICLDNKEKIFLSEPILRIRNNLADFKSLVEFAPVELKPGETRRLIVLYDNGMASALCDQFMQDPSVIIAQTNEIRNEVVDYWNNKTSIPYGHISVPDKGIQELIDASLRNIWQAREIKDDMISFQVGPTCYRGLWFVDGAFILEAATMFGKGEEARQGINYMLTFQAENGKFEKHKPDFWKINGIALWTCVRHAMLTQDKEWLRSIWPKLRKTVHFIQELRDSTLLNDISLDDGLIPPGSIDGGLWGGFDQPEYTNIYWNLAGLKSMVQAARWLGEEKDSHEWEKEYNDFYEKFQQAANRDMTLDSFGNKYLPVMMDPKDHDLPQRAQWAFCHGIYPGQLFDPSDPIATGTMNMLHTTLQEGMVMGTGWIIEGIWNYFASFYGHACLWMGDRERVVESLYAFANHASPLFAWREEHNTRDMHHKFVGDMPHNWASAEFLRLVVHMLALDRGNELHLFEGLPVEWIQPGMVIQLKDISTPFGTLTYSLHTNEDGDSGRLDIKRLSDPSCDAIYIHQTGWLLSGVNSPIRLDPGKDNSIIINYKDGKYSYQQLK